MGSRPLQVLHQHPWDVAAKQAIDIQNRLRGLVVREDALDGPVSTVAGVDVGFEAGGTVTRAAVAVLSFPHLRPGAEAVARLPTGFPYVPGLLSFREIPAVLEALGMLAELPDLILCDGQGYAHPRRFGIACHLGVLTGLPTIGVGKTRLIGRHAELPRSRGTWVPLLDGDEIIGAVVRSREGVSPLYVSPGHRVSLETAVEYTLRCTVKFKLPETTRRAHRLASG